MHYCSVWANKYNVIYQNWYDIFAVSFQVVWDKFFSALPNVFVAIVIFIIGWVLAHAVSKTIKSIVSLTKIDNALAKLKVDQVISRFGWRLDAGKFIGELVRWFLIIAFLLVSSDIVGLSAVSNFLNDILLYIPNVVIAAVILLIAAIVSSFLQKIVIASASAAQLAAANFAGLVTKWAVLILGFLIAVEQLGIAQVYLGTLYTGIIAMLAIAGGLAFGLGGKDQAATFLARLSEEAKERR